MSDIFPEIADTMDQSAAEAYAPEPNEVCISIRGHDSPVPELKPGWRAVLYLEFNDDPWPDWRDRAVGMTVTDARRIIEFVEQHRDARKLVIHCLVGVSRSAGVRLALRSCYCGLDPDRRVLNPNVYSLVCGAFHDRRREQTD
jgi:predicted protein tyrosine phosphatase